MRLKIIATATLVVISSLNSQIHALENIIIDSIIKSNELSLTDKTQIINDIKIKWLNENTTFYRGSDMSIDAEVNEDASDKSITWQINDLDNKSGVINLYSKENNKAILEAVKVGRAEIMALAKDGSNSTRQITLNVKDYLSDDPNKLLISKNITPIQSRNISKDKKLLQVEVKKSINSSDKLIAVDTYLSKLAQLGDLSIENINLEHEDYEFYTINILGLNNIEIEVRVDIYDNSYYDIKDKLININKYNETKEDEMKPGALPEDELLEDEEESKEDNNIADKIVIVGGQGSQDNPLSIEANKSLTSKEKIDAIKKCLELLKGGNTLEIVNIKETEKYSAYTIKVSEKILRTKNDFYIEIIVDKEDEKSYKKIIEMLNKINDDINIKDDLENNNNIDSSVNSNGTGNNLSEGMDSNKDKEDLTYKINEKNHNSDLGLKIENKYNNTGNIKFDLENSSQINNINLKEQTVDEEIKGLKQEKLKSEKLLLTTATGTIIGSLMIGKINKKRLE